MINDKASVASKSSISSSEVRKKCVGDFCNYSVDEEYHVSEHEKGTKLWYESLRAKARHRRLNEKDERILHDEDESNELKKEEDYISEFMSFDQSNELKTIPFKTIVLARQEITELDAAIDLPDNPSLYMSIPWPDAIKQWWIRIGHSYAPARGNAILPATALHSIIENESSSSSHTMAMGMAEKDNGGSQSLRKHTKRNAIGNTHTHASSLINGRQSLSAPTLGGLGKTSDLTSLAADATIRKNRRESINKVPYDLENSVSAMDKKNASKLGHVSWFYSTATVCQKCYLIYRQLNKAREGAENKKLRQKQLKNSSLGISHREGSTSIAGSDMQWTEMSETQQKLIERLSQAKKKAEQTEASEFSEVSMNSKSAKPVRGPPQSLPPLPWQLHDDSLKEKYEKHQPSAFLRGIRAKAQQVAVLVHHDKMLHEQHLSLRYSEQEIRNGKYRGESEAEQKWKIATGQNSVMNEDIGKKKKKRSPKKRNIDPSRFLHPWQRDMDAVRREQDAQPPVQQHNLKSSDVQTYKDNLLSSLSPSPSHSLQSVGSTSTFQPSVTKSKGKFASSDSVGHSSGHDQAQKQSLADFFVEQHKHRAEPLPPLQTQEPLQMSPYAHYTRTGPGSIGQDSSSDSLTGYSSLLSAEDGDGGSVSRPVSKLDDSSTFKPRSAISRQKSTVKKVVSFIGLTHDDNDQGTGARGSVVSALSSSSAPMTESSLMSVTASLRDKRDIQHGDNCDDDNEDDDDDDEGIGWSPFVIPTS